MNSKNLLAVVNRIQNLPTLPEVVEKVLALVDDPETSTANLAKIISNDQALMSKVLKVVNSAYYGLPRKISTLTQATVILGFNTIKNLVLTASVFSTFGSDGVQRDLVEQISGLILWDVLPVVRFCPNVFDLVYQRRLLLPV